MLILLLLLSRHFRDLPFIKVANDIQGILLKDLEDCRITVGAINDVILHITADVISRPHCIATPPIADGIPEPQISLYVFSTALVGISSYCLFLIYQRDKYK
ncbi:uncharacterized protein BO72DRAFT_499791 [Aspergillus fijiensis CBS 313.89]|uniref:Uncharacterized protein n=1 Tax=Aspergillus fijiensis CBS 313.89 TaxID=1448319 RepID=A0A8G1RKV7_9EURO|nr:uncharacterized protein BO72DRAFT_499791 [Aspergillus fijiensis CBS 313.89]RAK73630.1 hypothetical protein BO72DRAFT_499791 [Aspergillus fijiensis CBS 313.89]